MMHGQQNVKIIERCNKKLSRNCRPSPHYSVYLHHNLIHLPMVGTCAVLAFSNSSSPPVHDILRGFASNTAMLAGV